MRIHILVLTTMILLNGCALTHYNNLAYVLENKPNLQGYTFQQVQDLYGSPHKDDTTYVAGHKYNHWYYYQDTMIGFRNVREQVIFRFRDGTVETVSYPQGFDY